MPSLQSSAIQLSDRYQPVEGVWRRNQRLREEGPQQSPAQTHLPPLEPAHLLQSSVMISSLPSIATTVDGITRQFYTTHNLPLRRLILPA